MSRYLITFAACIAVGFSANPSLGQNKYNPEHPEVEKTVTQMVNYLKATGDKEASLGHRVLIALAISESVKRYEGYVPKDDPKVVEACRDITEALKQDGWFEDGSFVNKLYEPMLCLIFLCDVDANKYAKEIQALLALIESRQQGGGAFGYMNEPTMGDTSQVQYVALAAWVAHKHGFNCKTKWGTGMLDWLIASQRPANFTYREGGRSGVDETGGGGWGYKWGSGDRDRTFRKTTHSLSAAGASALYIVADWLGLNQRSTGPKGKKKDTKDLPRDVFLHEVKKGPKSKPVLVKYDEQKLRRCQNNANIWFSKNFSPKAGLWNYYYLYAFERFAYFRETADGSFGGNLATWYDQGFLHIRKELTVQNSGNNPYAYLPRGRLAEEDESMNTAFGVLFLVRSTELMAIGNRKGRLKASKGFGDGNLRSVNGKLIGEEIVRNTEELMKLIDNPTDEDDLNRIKQSFKNLQLTGDAASKGKQRQLIRGLVTHRRPGPRWAGVNFLANRRDIENVPALIYAVSDPNFEIAMKAHNGLRFISRKIDSISLPKDPKKEDFMAAKKQWEDWYLSIRPNGQLLDRRSK